MTTKWKVQFKVDEQRFEPLMTLLMRMPTGVQDLGFSLEDGGPSPAATDQKPAAWQRVVALTNEKPVPVRTVSKELTQAGMAKGSVYNAINKACEHRVVRKVSVRGVPHLVREKR